MKRVKTKGKNRSREEQIRKETTRDLNDKISLLWAVATVDELGITDDQLCAVYKRYERYSGHIHNKLADLKTAQDTIERECNVELKGWS